MGFFLNIIVIKNSRYYISVSEVILYTISSTYSFLNQGTYSLPSFGAYYIY